MRKLLFASMFAVVVGTAQAHFVFVVPQGKDSSEAIVIFSDTLEADDQVTMEKVEGLKLKVKDAAGKVSDLTFTRQPHSFKVTVPGAGSRIVFGSVDYGIIAKKDGKPYRLTYYPKAVVGPLPIDGGTLGGDVVTELVPNVANGKVKFRAMAKGKPLADADGTVLLPDGGKTKVKTDKLGYTPFFASGGRYGVYVWHMEDKAGDYNGKNYEQAKYYATLVVDVATKYGAALSERPIERRANAG